VPYDELSDIAGSRPLEVKIGPLGERLGVLQSLVDDVEERAAVVDHEDEPAARPEDADQLSQRHVHARRVMDKPTAASIASPTS
jgi:hypothetical protein